ncbi:MAG TPA: hypothetical protein VNZ94_01710 [Xanthobacteraceae bacterium]|nr:hypothetical protein [Xanthobacteraceae bacterium]
MTTHLDLSAANNATWTSDEIPLRDAAGAVLAMPEGVKVRMQLRQPADSVNVALDLSIGNGLSFVDQEAAIIRVEVSATRMRDIAPAAYAYDIIVEQPTGRVIRAVEGTVTIAQGVTR